MILKEYYKSTTDIKDSNIFILDNDLSNISELKSLVCDMANVDFSQNPNEALSKINSVKYDLIIVDLSVSQMSAFEFAGFIKKSHLNFITPIMFVSSNLDTHTILNCYEFESAVLLDRPFDSEVAKMRISNILKTEALKKSLEKEQELFVATLTHDLKSPINAEICALTQLLEKNKSSHNSEMLEELLNSAKYMKLITENILCFYKQKNKGLSLKKEFVNFEKLVCESINDLKYLADDKNVKINFNNNVLNPTLEVDFLEIKRVINNLLSNAIEYSYSNNCIDIVLNLHNDNMVFEIRDYGIGINTENLTNVFDEYMSLAKQQKKTGFGLGLNICKKIIEKHDGQIFIDSKYGAGTSIKFCLPA